MAKPTKKTVSTPNNRLAVPDLAFGDWVQDNDQWLAPAMKIAGAASMFIPGVGPVIGGALQAGAQGVQAYGQGQDANDAIQGQNVNNRRAAFNKSLAQQNMANGGFINYTGQDHMGPNGGIPIDAQGNPSAISGANTTALVEEGEVAATVDGKPYVFSKRLGTADKANKIKNKYKKRLDVNDKISQETMNRELKSLIAENEALQPKTNPNPKKLAFGDPPSSMTMDEYLQFQQGSNSFATDVSPFIAASSQPNNQYDMWRSTIDQFPRGQTPQGATTVTGPNRGMLAPNLADPSLYNAGMIDPGVTVTGQRPTSGTPTSSVPSSGASPTNLPDAQSQGAGLLPNMNPDLTTFAGAGVPYPTSLGDVADLSKPLDAVQTSAGDPEVYDPAKAALPGIIGQTIAGVGGNALAAALYKRPDTVNPALVNPATVNYSNERLAARENATLAKRSGLQTLRSVPGSTEAMKAQAGALEAGVSRGLGQQLGQSYQRQEDVNAGRQFQASSQNAQAKTQADMFNTRMLQDFREKQMGYVEGAVGSVQGALSDYNTANRMGDLMNMEAGRSGYQVIIDPATGKTKLVPVPGFWKNKQ